MLYFVGVRVYIRFSVFAFREIESTPFPFSKNCNIFIFFYNIRFCYKKNEQYAVALSTLGTTEYVAIEPSPVRSPLPIPGFELLLAMSGVVAAICLIKRGR